MSVMRYKEKMKTPQLNRRDILRFMETGVLATVFGGAPLARAALINRRADLVVYGATPAGIMTAVVAARAGLDVILAEPSNRVGGMVTGGLGLTDIGEKQLI